MGCDIHLMVEKKLGTYGDNQQYSHWAVVRRMPMDNDYARRMKEEKEKGEVGYWTRRYRELELSGGTDHWFYDGRNYDLFAMLADVRNGYGFAGMDTGDGFKPISQPKGIPDQSSSAYEKLVDMWDGDGHSHSYLTLKELLEYDWKGQTTKKRGWVSPSEFETYTEQGKPDSWSGMVRGGGVIHVSNAEMNEIINGNFPKVPNKMYYTQIEWEISYYDHASYFVDNLHLLQELSEDGIGEDVRIVFFFDN